MEPTGSSSLGEGWERLQRSIKLWDIVCHGVGNKESGISAWLSRSDATGLTTVTPAASQNRRIIAV